MENKTIDWSRWLCRCSSIAKIMSNSQKNPPITEKQKEKMKELLDKRSGKGLTDPQALELAGLIAKDENSRNVVLSDTAVGYLVEAYAWETEGMCSITKEMDVEYFERGKKTEPESIELLSFVDNYPYEKNTQRFSNDFLTGEMDVYRGKDARRPLAIGDIKSCKDYPTFLYKIHKGLDAGNEEQLQGYSDIGECGDIFVAFTLPTMPATIREQYKWKLANKMEAVTIESPDFLRAWNELERSMIFDHIPAHRRVFKIPVTPFEKSMQQAIYERVRHCRQWLFDFDNFMKKLNQ